MSLAIKITAVIPYFEAHDTIFSALNSLLCGTRAPDEIVVVDDGSSAYSNGQLGQAIQTLQDGRIRLIRKDYNGGGAAARNTAVAEAQHEWIFCLDSDNLVAPSLLKTLGDIVEKRHLVSGAIVPERILFFAGESQRLSHFWHQGVGPFTVSRALRSAVMPGASGNYLFSKDSWKLAGGYPLNAGSLDTWGFGLRQMFSGCSFYVAPRTYYFHRITADSYWSRENSMARIRSLRATGMLLEYPKGLKWRDLSRILGANRSGLWFQRLRAKDVRLLSPRSQRKLGYSASIERLMSSEREALAKELALLEKMNDVEPELP